MHGMHGMHGMHSTGNGTEVISDHGWWRAWVLRSTATVSGTAASNRVLIPQACQSVLAAMLHGRRASICDDDDIAQRWPRVAAVLPVWYGERLGMGKGRRGAARLRGGGQGAGSQVLN